MVQSGTVLAGTGLIYNKFGGVFIAPQLPGCPIVRKVPGKPVETGFFQGKANPLEETHSNPIKTTFKSADITKVFQDYYGNPKEEVKGFLKTVSSFLDNNCNGVMETHEKYFDGVSEEDIAGNKEFYFDSPDGYTIKSMKYGKRATGNCGPVSVELASCGYTENVISMTFNDGYYHAAGNLPEHSYYGTEDCDFVLDYTARQYDNKVPFPLIMRSEDWQAWVEAHVLTQYNGMLKELYVSNPF